MNLWGLTLALCLVAGLSDPRVSVAAPAAVWSDLPALPMPLSNNAVAAVATPEGMHVYSFLGLDASRRAEGITRRAFRWRTGEARWTELPAVPGPTRLAATAQAVGNRVYVFGGYSVAPDGAERSLPIVAVWDTDTEIWSRGAEIPLPVDDAVSGVSSNGRVYLVSGWHDRDNVSAVQVYDPAADRWAQATPIPGVPVFGHAGAVSDNSIVYIGGVRRRVEPRGFEIERGAWYGKIDAQDPLSIRWERLPDPPGPPRYRAAAGVLGALFVFAGGTDRPYNFDGVGYDGKIAKPLAEVVAYDGISRRWQSWASLPVASMDHRGLAVADGRACLVGGMAAGPRVTSAVRCLALAATGSSGRQDLEPDRRSGGTSEDWRRQPSASTLSEAEPKEKR